MGAVHLPSKNEYPHGRFHLWKTSLWIFRSSYLLTNFKLGFIQDRDDDNAPRKGRPCLAEVRWYGATDDGLIDIRENIELWSTDTEIEQWHILCMMEENKHLSDLDISKKILESDTLDKERVQHLVHVNGGD